MAQILQGAANNYETDLIFPIIQTAAAIAGIDYAQADEKTKVSLKVIGDHVRAVVHMMADGISDSNTGRGYVLRRLLRRVVRHGRLLGITQEFTPKVAETAIQLSEIAFPNVRERADSIKSQLLREESRFLETLERGEKQLAEILDQAKNQISGLDDFTLYDTYGFPLELTQEIAQEQGLTIDIDGFNLEMKQQQARSKAAHETIDLTVQGSLDKLAQQIHSTEFMGYTESQSIAQIEAVLFEGKIVEAAEAGTSVQIVLNQTPFYAESGGQIGDKGYLSGNNLLVRIADVQKESGIFVHFGRIERGTLQVGATITAIIDRACRRRAQANHTATHLLQAALKKIVDDSISQAGSLVDFDRLRFDFNFARALTADELKQVEDQINTWIAEAHDTQIAVMSISEAKAKGAIAMFGEKYGAEVRVIDVPGVSMELCGGTHVNNTAEIGLFKIMAESGIAAGVRRIEAVAGPAVLAY
jgi:alanyl-tRNA synthetase